MHRKIDKTGSYFIQKVKKEGIRVEDWKMKTGRYIKSERSKYYNPFKKVVFNYNFKEEPFISIRISLGRRGGLPEIRGIRLVDIPKLSDRIKHKKIFTKYQGKLVDKGGVSWAFDSQLQPKFLQKISEPGRNTFRRD